MIWRDQGGQLAVPPDNALKRKILRQLHITKTPLYKITVPENAPPFTQIALDLITGLPKSRGFDAILTIVDHGCS
jgi:hypothetical protein